jgi:RHS repeat-associated protein
VRAFYRYDDFGNVVSVRQRALVNGQFPEVDDNAPQSSDCQEVPASVAADETYYCYDEFERLRLSRGAGVSGSELLEYDGLDRRDARIERVGASEVRRDLSYVGTSELLSREIEGGGQKRFYDYDSLGDRQGQQVTDGSGSRYRAYRKDANGSVLALEDDGGDVPAGERYAYDPYGELESEPSAVEARENPFRFEGFYYDSGVRSYDMHARAYRPEHARFLTQDRYASASQDLLLQADPLTQNRYAFAGANPVTNIEFDGHEPPTSYDRDASQPIRDKDGTQLRKATPQKLRRQSNDGPDIYYQQGNENAESIGAYSEGPGRASDFKGQQAWHADPTAYACQACPSPAALAKRRAKAGRLLAGVKTAVRQDIEALRSMPKDTVEGLYRLGDIAYRNVKYQCGNSLTDPLDRDPRCPTFDENLELSGAVAVLLLTRRTPPAAKEAPRKITGYAVDRDGVRHGLAQAIARDAGRGVSPRAMLDAVRNAEPQWQAGRQTWRFEGDDAVIVLNTRGQVVTTWAKSRSAWRNPLFRDPSHGISRRLPEP